MATASHIDLTNDASGFFRGRPVLPESAKMASQLLQKNHDDFHIFFNREGFHNHIAHHLLAIYALGATEKEIQRAYDVNVDYQRPQYPLQDDIVHELGDTRNFMQYLGDEKYYHDYQTFFQRAMHAKGWQAVINEYLFAKDDRAESLLVRMFAGFLHPLIHLGYGVEFQQPAIIAEALAQAAVHSDWIGKLLRPAEERASQKSEDKTLFELLEKIRTNDEIVNAPHWEDGNKIRDGLLARAGEEVINLASQWRVKPENLEKKMAEMINASVYFTCAAQHPPKQIKFDFYFMHCVNCSIFFSSFLQQPWLNASHMTRLLEWKGRLDLAMYASRKSPGLLVSEITEYTPKRPSSDGWKAIFDRVDRHEDDGHAAKFIRALAHGQQICAKYEVQESWPIQGDMWLKLGHMVIDSVEDDGAHWVRSAGFPEAWESFHDRKRPME